MISKDFLIWQVIISSGMIINGTPHIPLTQVTMPGLVSLIFFYQPRKWCNHHSQTPLCDEGPYVSLGASRHRLSSRYCQANINET